jgi:hypothetical protein
MRFGHDVLFVTREAGVAVAMPVKLGSLRGGKAPRIQASYSSLLFKPLALPVDDDRGWPAARRLVPI